MREAHREFRLIGRLGAEVHFHATAAGKAIAAFLPQERRAEILTSLPLKAITKRTFTDPLKVEKDWAEIRRRGFALNNEETIVGAAFLAAPLFDSRESVCGSITVGIPKARLTTRRAKEIAVRLKDACRRR